MENIIKIGDRVRIKNDSIFHYGTVEGIQGGIVILETDPTYHVFGRHNQKYHIHDVVKIG